MFTNSPLVTYTQISPNKTVPRKNEIERITIHCVVGQVTCKRLGEIFAPSSRQASSNYGVCTDGIAQFVEEKDRSWCTGTGNLKGSNDHLAVTIEVASDTKHPYAVRDDVFENLVKLCIDICKRNSKNKMLFLGDKAKTETYKPKPNEMILTAHRWYQNTICPGDYLYSRFQEICDTVNKTFGTYKNPAKTIIVGDVITTDKDMKAYSTAAKAIAQGNTNITYKAGSYFIYKIYLDGKGNKAYNISKQMSTPGGWVML